MDPDQTRLLELMRAAYPELRQHARRLLRLERSGHTLQPTALANEVVARILNRKTNGFSDTKSLVRYGLAEMRSILADSGRKHQLGLAHTNNLPPSMLIDWPRLGTIAEMAEALEQLEKIDPRAREVVELRYFLELTPEETAQFLNLSVRTVNEDWTFARAWLAARLKP